eukprot:PhM_4_TR13066/c0_g2_i1/m.64459/K07944/ARL3; ADP-ribosylation factor-like protein 3
MGLLDFFRGIKANQTKESRLLILGLDNAGKTSILKKLSDEDISHIMPTQGFNVKTMNTSGFKLNVWDIGGQRAIRPYWRNYYDQTGGLVFVIDAADQRRLEEAGIELHQLLEEEQLSGVPLLVYANKQDLVNASTPKDIADAMQLPDLRDRAWQIQGCSAKTGNGLHEGLEWLIRNLKA